MMRGTPVSERANYLPRPDQGKPKSDQKMFHHKQFGRGYSLIRHARFGPACPTSQIG
jgi:hypothetical protein